MRQILKFKIEITDVQEIRLPMGNTILCVQLQNNEPHIWVMACFDENVDFRYFRFRIYGTGHKVDEFGGYIGTFQKDGGVWHLFEIDTSNF